MRLTILALLLSSTAFAQQLPFLVVTQQSFEESPCRKPIPTADEINQELEAASRTSLNSLANDLTKNINREGKSRILSCAGDALCVVDTLWGEDLGRKTLFILHKYGANVSDHASPWGAYPMTEVELDHVLGALSDLPANLQRAGEGRFSVATKQKKGAAAYTVGKATELYESWRRYAVNPETFSARRTILHEVGHKADGTKSMLSLGWRRARGTDNCGISQYANSNSKEDFAEAFVAYRYDARTLKERCLPKYEYMKNLYGNVEYLSEETCR